MNGQKCFRVAADFLFRVGNVERERVIHLCDDRNCTDGNHSHGGGNISVGRDNDLIARTDAECRLKRKSMAALPEVMTRTFLLPK